MPDYTTELEFAIATAIEAGEEIRRLYDANSARTYTKPDESPVTALGWDASGVTLAFGTEGGEAGVLSL